mgnify:FL=1
MGSELEDNIIQERVTQLEDAVLNLSADLQHVHMRIKEIQNMIIKIATNQQQLAERVSMWPYIKVEAAKKRRPPKSGD